jgi:hypothetical protein
MSRNYIQKILTALVALVALALCASVSQAQPAGGSIRGQITDELGGVIVGIEVALVNANGERLTSRTNKEGAYVFNAVPAGAYTLQAAADGFAPHIQPLEITSKTREVFDVKLKIAVKEKGEVTISSESATSTDPNSNASGLRLREKDLETLPDDPDELAAALQALAGPASGPGGGQFYVDGFTLDGRIPPKNSIKEVRINQNPFTAEFDKLGYGRIFITTKPGSNKYHGTAMFHFNDEALNSRNAFAPERAPFQLRYYTFDASGPLVGNRSSFFVNLQRREVDDNAVINAITLTPNLNVSPLSQTVIAPRRELYFSTRVDYQVSPNHSLLAQYVYTPSNANNLSVGDFALPSRALRSDDTAHNVRFTLTSILSPTAANEVRFQYYASRRTQQGDGSQPTIRVLDAFLGGGANYSNSANDLDAWEVHNYTTRTHGGHTLRFGGRYRNLTYRDFSPTNFAGTYTFAGGFGPELDGDNRVVNGSNGPVIVPVSSIERYRRTLLFGRAGLSPEEIRARGGGASQFSIAGGNPEINGSQRDLGVFLQDDWRVRENFTFSVGLRYENQSNVSSNLNFAPRIGFAWSPGKSGGKQVIRGGVGIFYDRVPLTLTLAARRFNGVTQRQYTVSDPQVLDLFPQAPSVETLSQFAVPQTVWQLGGDVRTPYFAQASLSYERQIFKNITFSTTYVYGRANHLLRARNINAPLPGTFDPDAPDSGVKPMPGEPNIYSYESAGVFKQQQLIFTATGRAGKKVNFFATYSLNKADSNTDGAGTFPASSYDLSDEFGRSSLDIRHRVNIGATITTVRGIELGPAIVWRSGIPFNIITGRDFNGDTLFTERPAFATDLNKPGVMITPFGAFDPNPGPGQTLIPRNYGEGPGFYGANLSLTKVFSFGGGAAGGPNDRKGGSSQEKPYKLTISIRVYNLFNTNNKGTPVGNLSSPLFGISNSTASEAGTNSATSNRRIWLHANFRF